MVTMKDWSESWYLLYSPKENYVAFNYFSYIKKEPIPIELQKQNTQEENLINKVALECSVFLGKKKLKNCVENCPVWSPMASFYGVHFPCSTRSRAEVGGLCCSVSMWLLLKIMLQTIYQFHIELWPLYSLEKPIFIISDVTNRLHIFLNKGKNSNRLLECLDPFPHGISFRSVPFDMWCLGPLLNTMLDNADVTTTASYVY